MICNGKVTMKYASVCSGIEAATVAWRPLGWGCEFLSEIEKHPKSLLEDKYGNETTIYGDFTKINANDHTGVEVIIGGTPCQSFSMAGARGGLEDARGNLSLEFIRLGKSLGSKWIIWENVPGVLSSAKGADLTTILSEFVGRELPTIKWSKEGFIEPTTENDYGIAWRILDGQHFGVPQRRRRLFVVGYLGDWRPPCSVLFEPESHSGNTKESRGKGQTTTREVRESNEASVGEPVAIRGNIIGRGNKAGGNGLGVDVGILPTLTSTDKHAVVHSNQGHTNIKEVESLPTLQASMGEKHNIPIVYENHGSDSRVKEVSTLPTLTSGAKSTGTPCLPIVYENHGQAGRVKEVGSLPALNAKAGTGGGNLPIVYEYRRMDTRMREVGILPVVESAFGTGGGNLPIVVNARQTPVSDEIIPPLGTQNTYGVQSEDTIRYLTPRECERAMGFPDDYTIKLPKTARYKALGNSMIVPIIQWLGQRIEIVDELISEKPANIPLDILIAFMDIEEDQECIEFINDAMPLLESLLAKGNGHAQTAINALQQALEAINQEES